MRERRKNNKIGQVGLAALLPVLLLAALLLGATGVPAAATASVTISFSQEISETDGTAGADTDQVDYTLTPEEAGSPLPSGAVDGAYEFTAQGSGDFDIPAITFTRAGSFFYNLTADVPSGWTGEPESYRLQVYTRMRGADMIYQLFFYDEDGEKVDPEFAITKAPKPLRIIDPPIRKNVNGTPDEDGNFTFVLKAGNVNWPMPEGSTNGEKRVSVTGEGTAEFGDWEYETTGTYTYTIREITGGLTGYIYDTTVYTLTDVVTLSGGKLSANRTITKKVGDAAAVEVDATIEELEFTNTYEKKEESDHPTPVDPKPDDPTPVDPKPDDPTPVDPTPVDPEPVDPIPVDPEPVDPEPAPVDPTPAKPGDTEEPTDDEPTPASTTTPVATPTTRPVLTPTTRTTTTRTTTTTTTIKKTGTTSAVKTGDESRMGGYGLVAVLAFTGLLILTVVTKRREQKR